ncbi:MAG: serine/threonine protein kinase [Coriobacteriales bacterium]|jgi:serine/threonine protein kinase|nr:serine/threonine protein kinase [Coriobacteriales bacterium]
MAAGPAPLILNRYRPIEHRARGGFAMVDIVWDTRLQRRVAMKRIPLTVAETDLPGINEARTAALLNDPHIVNVLDFEVTGTEALLIMEYVDGPTLGALMRESPELLDLDIIASLAGGIADALGHAHENQVLHLDIKPDNILIDHKGHVKVTDFGLAQLSSVAGFAEPQGGTIGYMPPEQLTAGEVDERTDLWACAILLYQLLTGHNPFLAHSAQESYDRILNEPIVLPSATRPDLDPTIDEVLLTALDVEKDGRFVSVAAFMRELTPLLGSPQAGTRKLKARVNQRDSEALEQGQGGDKRGGGDGSAVPAEASSKTGTAEPSPLEPSPLEQREHPAFIPAALPLLDRLPFLVRTFLARLAAALAAGSMTFLGLSGFDLSLHADSQFLLLMGCVAIVALAGYLVPQLGSALAFCALAAGLFARGWTIVGVGFLVLFAAWWLFVGRLGRGDSLTVTLTALLGACWMPFAVPLLAGWSLSWRRATLASLASGLLFVLIATLSATDGFAHSGLSLQPAEGLIPDALIALATEPMTWVFLLAWVISTLTVSLLSRRGTRLVGVLGAGLATVILAFAILIVPLSWQVDLPIAQTVMTGSTLALSFILVCLLIWLGIPSRLEGQRGAGKQGSHKDRREG